MIAEVESGFGSPALTEAESAIDPHSLTETKVPSAVQIVAHY
jgi:hypothetical protein